METTRTDQWKRAHGCEHWPEVETSVFKWARQLERELAELKKAIEVNKPIVQWTYTLDALPQSRGSYLVLERPDENLEFNTIRIWKWEIEKWCWKNHDGVLCASIAPKCWAPKPEFVSSLNVG